MNNYEKLAISANRGVKLPEWRSAKSLWLIYLYKFRNYQVHKDTISDFVRNLKKIGRDQQVRHLAADEELKIVYDNRCVNCGALENHHHPRFRDTIVVLQKGHIDPNKPEVLENIIPQCQICNQTYKDNFVYDENGYIKAINNENFVLRSKPEVLKRIYELLKKKF
ncbi:9468_t:CDS:2, partial [Cetraspora pellucida]